MEEVHTGAVDCGAFPAHVADEKLVLVLVASNDADIV
jgi:hypothetical protein